MKQMGDALVFGVFVVGFCYVTWLNTYAGYFGMGVIACLALGYIGTIRNRIF